MMINENDGKKKKKLFSSVRIVYGLLGIAAIAVSVLSYSAVTDSIKQSAEKSFSLNSDEKTTSESQLMTQPPETVIQETRAIAQETQAEQAVFGNNSETIAAKPEQPVTQAASTEAPVAEEPQFDAESCILPLTACVSKDFSLGYPVYSQTMGDWRTHNGVDFSGLEGDEVLSMADCTVSAVYQDDLWGGVIETDCNGICIKYCGMSFNEEVAVGEELKAGDRLGTLAVIPIEKKDGCHLHIEMRKEGELCDPLEILGLAENDID